MTNRELLGFLQTLTEEQLDQPVLLSAEDKGYDDIIADVCEEDFINPSGEGAEPLSFYLEEFPEDDYSDEPIVIAKGQVIYYIS